MCYLVYFTELNTNINELDSNLQNKVDTTDARLSDARTPTAHTHNDLYYTKTEVNNLNWIKGSCVDIDSATKEDDNTFRVDFSVDTNGSYLILGRVRQIRTGTVIGHVNMFQVNNGVNGDPCSGSLAAPYDWGNLYQYANLAPGAHTIRLKTNIACDMLTFRAWVIKLR